MNPSRPHSSRAHLRDSPPGRTRFLGVCLGLGLAACRPTDAPRPPTPDARPPTWRYDAELGEGAASITVRMCFDGATPAALRPIVGEALEHIEDLTIDGRSTALSSNAGVVPLAALRPGECVRWRVDLDEAAARQGGRALSRVGDSVLVRQSRWLLWPTDAPKGARPELTLRTPPGVRASVPWPIVRGSRDDAEVTYALDVTVARWLGYNAFGRLDIDRFEHQGAEIEIVRLDRPIACDAAGVRRWITDAADGAAMLYGRYPRDRLQVVVVPVDEGDGADHSAAIPFGAAARGGGAGVYLLLDEDATARRLPGAWTTVHEFLHHGMPFVKDAWMSEGFVSYYTEVMRTRQGHRDEATGWLELWDAFERGRAGGRGLTLQQTSDDMHGTFAYQRVYWGGAAIAFELDVRLRLDSGGELGLDDAMRHLRECCGDATFQYDAQALLERLDRWYGQPLFTTIARRHLASREFPDIEELYGRLGLAQWGGAIVIDPSSPGAAARAAIMAPRPAAASAP